MAVPTHSHSLLSRRVCLSMASSTGESRARSKSLSDDSGKVVIVTCWSANVYSVACLHWDRISARGTKYALWANRCSEESAHRSTVMWDVQTGKLERLGTVCSDLLRGSSSTTVEKTRTETYKLTHTFICHSVAAHQGIKRSIEGR